jgi:dsDNA-specific endonuclease/ATPase MutS2
MVTIRDAAAAAGISRQAMSTRCRRAGIPIGHVVLRGRTHAAIRRDLADAAGITNPPTAAHATVGVRELAAIVESLRAELAVERDRRVAVERAHASAQQAATDAAWVEKSTARRCDKLEERLDRRSQDVDDLRRQLLARDSTIAALRQDVALLRSRSAADLLLDAPRRVGFWSRIVGRG